MAIKKIAHLADIHIRKSIARHAEYRIVFNELYEKLRTSEPDRIVIAGDLFHDYIKLEGELLVLSSEFLNNLSKIAKVIITRGNHDVSRSAPKRTDAIEALVRTMDNPNIHYLNRTFMFDDDNIVWAVWKHGEKRNNPYGKDFERLSYKTYVDIFHDPINSASNSDGFDFKSKTYRSAKDFLGDISMFGDIHKYQTIGVPSKAYSSSLIEQNFGEGDDQFHGFLLWDVESRTHVKIPVYNPTGHFTVDVNQYTNFDKLQFDIPSKVPNKRIRVRWKTLPGVKTTENMRKIEVFLQAKYNPLSIKHFNDFIVDKKITIEEKSDMENITKREVIHKIITEYLKKIGIKDDVINDVLELDVEIENRLVIEELTNIQWSIVKLVGKNFRSYEDISIDWQDRDGVYQIVGENGAGKSTINQLITYVAFGKSLETDFRKKFGDARFINNKLDVASCEGYMVIDANGEYYAIKRSTSIKKNKEGEITGAPTVVTYYKLNGPNDDLDERVNLDKLTEEDRNKTQARINEIIGSYENFIRVTLTTADTLNSVLSSDKAVFIDSLLFDAGLNIFDLRLKEFKKYKEQLINDTRLTNFNVTDQVTQVQNLNKDILTAYETIDQIHVNLKETQTILADHQTRKDVLLQSMHQIDQELASTSDIEITKALTRLRDEYLAIEAEEKKLKATIDALKDKYDLARLEELLAEKDSHKSKEFEKRTAINKHRMQIEQVNSAISKLNGDIMQMMKEGASIKKEIQNLESSKTCPTCGQEKGVSAIEAIKNTIKEKETEMFAIASQIGVKRNEQPNLQFLIEGHQKSILDLEEEIKQDSINFQSILEEIGKITNDKAEFEKSEKLKIELKAFPMKKENVVLKGNDLKAKLQKYNDQKQKIEENNQIRLKVDAENKIIVTHTIHIDSCKNGITNTENQIKTVKETIAQKEDMIKLFYANEKREEVLKIYGESIHRDGIPTQILTDTLLPNINNVLSKLLETADFDVFLDKDDLRPKFFHNDHPTAVIDCISASGMERTFSVYCLKIALNQSNTKSKSTFLAVDEIMGKLKGDYVDRFVELLHLSKKFYKKVLIIEPTHEVNPDYLLQVEMNSKHVSKLIQD